MENIKVYIKNRNKSEKYIWNIYNKKYNSQKRIINNINNYDNPLVGYPHEIGKY